MSLSIVTTTLFLDDSLESQRLEILAAEKGDNVIVRHATQLPAEVRTVHPTGTLPVLLDKHLILHGSQLIDAYFEERFPAPALLPVTPVARSQVRYLSEQIKSWYALARVDRGALHEQLDEFAGSLDPQATWFAGDSFTFIDIAAAPLLHNLFDLGYTLIPNTPLDRYRRRLIARPSVAQLALSPFKRCGTITAEIRVFH